MGVPGFRSNSVDLRGKRFGRLVALAPRQPKKSKALRWMLVCDCGNTHESNSSNLRTGRVQSCGCLHKERTARARWKGGKYTHSSGYVYVYEPGTGKRTTEHRSVMQEQLGRELLPGESVHHKNGIRNDNRPENLELWSNRQPSGQRVVDKIAYAKEILSLYEPQSLSLITGAKA